MNLNNDPKIEELKIILEKCDDNKADHIAWADKSGLVHITPLPNHLTPAGWVTENKDLVQFRLETFMKGNQYVGPSAINDEKWMNRLYKAFVTNWAAKNTGYIDNF